MNALQPAGLILAAGLSRRMGRFKPLLELDGASLLARAVGIMRAAGAGPVYVVTGHRAEELRPHLAGLDAAEVFNPDYARDMFTSVRAGVAALPAGIDAFFLLPVDIPLVKPANLAALAEAFAEKRPAVALPDFLGEPGHPPLIAAALIPAILAWSGQGGLQGLLAGHADQTIAAPVCDQGVLLDMDTPEAYAALQARLIAAGHPQPAEVEALLGPVLGVPAPVRAHCRAVAAAALALGRALCAADNPIDLACLEAAALVHDLAKGRPGHAARGAEFLRRWGWEAAADLVAVHAELTPPAAGPVGAAEVLYLADKLIEGDRPVAIDQRFAAKLARHGDAPGVTAAINRRWRAAQTIAARIEQICQKPLAALLGRA
ncbi:MAG: NTP transferase domain-containing protein [Pseudomonadota bacterium]